MRTKAKQVDLKVTSTYGTEVGETFIVEKESRWFVRIIRRITRKPWLFPNKYPIMRVVGIGEKTLTIENTGHFAVRP